MLNRIGPARHLVVGGTVVVLAALGAVGVVGAGDQGVLRPEHFDAKEVTVRPDGGDGVRIREVVDIDFGSNDRRGYQRIVPDDYGEPIDIVASSPDANDDLDVVDFGSETRIRIGDPSITFTGQHRYVLEYTLPDAGLSNGELALDIIDSDETFDTDRFDVILIGFGISDADAVRCDVGRRGAVGGCAFDRVDGDEFRTVVEPLRARRGITVYASVGALATPEFGPAPALPERRPLGFPVVAITQLVLGGAAAFGVFAWFRRRGSNEVFGAGGAADAAFLPTPPPPRNPQLDVLPAPHGLAQDLPAPVPVATVATHRVPDDRLADLATIEFVPPRGVESWQGNMLLRESVDDRTVSAWFSEMVAREAIEITGGGTGMTLRAGRNDVRLSDVDRRHLAALFASTPVVELGKYDKSFAAAWSGIRSEQRRFLRECGWWQGSQRGFGDGPAVLVGISVLVVLAAGIWATAVFGLLTTFVGAVAFSVWVVLVVSCLAYLSMLASRTATGSALTLQTESFRRFLEASEGRHVEWAWKNGLIREYSAWAVALGAAEAWSAAIESSNIDGPDRLTEPLLVHTYASTITSSRVAPSSSGGGSGGGGGVGGGGGGGSSGSW